MKNSVLSPAGNRNATKLFSKLTIVINSFHFTATIIMSIPTFFCNFFILSFLTILLLLFHIFCNFFVLSILTIANAYCGQLFCKSCKQTFQTNFFFLQSFQFDPEKCCSGQAFLCKPLSLTTFLKGFATSRMEKSIFQI